MYASVSSECVGCRACEAVCPEIFRMNSYEIAEAYVNPIPKDIEAQTKEAANNCPVNAITLE